MGPYVVPVIERVPYVNGDDRLGLVNPGRKSDPSHEADPSRPNRRTSTSATHRVGPGKATPKRASSIRSLSMDMPNTALNSRARISISTIPEAIDPRDTEAPADTHDYRAKHGAQFDVDAAAEATPHDGVSRWRIARASEIAPEPCDLVRWTPIRQRHRARSAIS